MAAENVAAGSRVNFRARERTAGTREQIAVRGLGGQGPGPPVRGVETERATKRTRRPLLVSEGRRPAAAAGPTRPPVKDSWGSAAGRKGEENTVAKFDARLVETVAYSEEFAKLRGANDK